MTGELEAALECLLFVSGEPLSAADMAHALQREETEVEGALRSLQAALKEQGSGLQLLRIAGGWQMGTRPEFAEAVGRLLTPRAARLSRAALETLAIVAYRQPVTSPEIEAVRGVSASGALKTLQERRLIVEAGRKMVPGRPILYVTTSDFLHYFGMADIQQLPPIDISEPPSAAAETVADGIPQEAVQTDC